MRVDMFGNTTTVLLTQCVQKKKKGKKKKNLTKKKTFPKSFVAVFWGKKSQSGKKREGRMFISLCSHVDMFLRQTLCLRCVVVTFHWRLRASLFVFFVLCCCCFFFFFGSK